MSVPLSGGAARLGRGAAALATLAVLVVGVPLGLARAVGWPLPHHIPTLSGVHVALTSRGVPDQVLLDALACVAWLAWLSVVLSIGEEAVAAAKGRGSRRIPVAGAFQPMAARLVAAILFASMALARPALVTSPAPSPAASAALVLQLRPESVVLESDVVSSGAPVPSASEPSPATSTGATAPVTYTVVRHDTLWTIAQSQLGDPLRWRDIFALNEGRLQPDGRALIDPSWIYPGWALVLPVAPDPATPPTAAPPLPAPISLSTTTTTPRLDPSNPGNRAPKRAVRARPPANDGGISRGVGPTAPVELPSGSVVAGSFAAGVLATVALGRLRRRHRYRYRPPRPGRDLTPPPVRPTLEHLIHASQDGPVDLEAESADETAEFPFNDDQRRLQPGRLEIGTLDGHPVAVEVTDVSGVTLSGPTVDAVARALLANLLVQAGPRAAEVLVTEDLAGRLLPGLASVGDMRTVASSDDAARVVEAERVARTRRLSAVDAVDADRFRVENPENPLPTLLVLLDSLPVGSIARWSALLADAARLGIAVLFLSDSPVATGHVALDGERTVTSAQPASLAERLVGVVMFGLDADEGVELLGSVNEANQEGDNDDDSWGAPGAPMTTVHLADETDNAEQSTSGEESWPECTPPVTPLLEIPGRPDRPIVVEVLGPLRITAFGQPVSTGLRARGRTLLAWALLRPEGATVDEIVDALWPDTPPDRVLKQFWHPLGDLRTYFRGPNGEALEVLEKIGEHYRPSPAEITCDLWDFQSALTLAASAGDEGRARVALRRAVDAYQGDLLAGSAERWVEPVRQDLHRRAVDAHLRLAELEDGAGRPGAAVAVLERIIDLDRYAEEPYRRLMALYASHGRHDAVTATWQMLQHRLADLDVGVDEATARLYRTLVAPDPEVQTASHASLR